MVSAICPKCHITLVEAQRQLHPVLGTAENTAARKARYVSNSWSGPEFIGEASFNDYFNHPGDAIVFASGRRRHGDAGLPDRPAVRHRVGGTSLRHVKSGSRPWTEKVWGDAHCLRRRDPVRLLGSGGQAVLAAQGRRHVHPAHRERRRRGRRPEHRRRRLRQLQDGRPVRDRRHQRGDADHHRHLRPGRQPAGAATRRRTSTRTRTRSTTSPRARTAPARPPTSATARRAMTARPASARRMVPSARRQRR